MPYAKRWHSFIETLGSKLILNKTKMLRLILLSVILLSIKSYSQTESYLKDERAPGSLEDIVKLLNLKNVKRITIFSQQKDTNIFVGEVIINNEGNCVEKRSCLGNNTYHKYNSNGNLIESIFFLSDNVDLLSVFNEYWHYEYIYNKNGDLIEVIERDKSGAVISRDSLCLEVIVGHQIPRYNGNSKHYTYNSSGVITKFVSKGFYLISSKSRKEEEYKRNKLVYKYEYNGDRKIIKYYKKLKRRSSKCEETTEFSYVNDNVIKLKSSYKDCRCLTSWYDNLLYRIEYY